MRTRIDNAIMETNLGWVRPFYTTFHEYLGQEAVSQRDHERVEAVERLCGPGRRRILELGAGCGQTASCMANAGHAVTAVEFAPNKAADARSIAQSVKSGEMRVVEADFYDVVFDEPFELVCYWDGFGVGTDSDQRRLLERIAGEWLVPGGCAIIDVFSPWRWIREAGKEQTLDRCQPSHRYRERRRWDYDIVNDRFLDTWCPLDDATGEPNEEMAITQSIRCYSPADFALLLEGTGLAITAAEAAAIAFPPTPTSLADDPLRSAFSYRVLVGRMRRPRS